jgi:hypothetical protein
VLVVFLAPPLWLAIVMIRPIDIAISSNHSKRNTDPVSNRSGRRALHVRALHDRDAMARRRALDPQTHDLTLRGVP